MIGDTADAIKETALNHGFSDIQKASSLEEAVKLASKAAIPGDVVLLSPACASWDMFESYEERGRVFKEAVHFLRG